MKSLQLVSQLQNRPGGWYIEILGNGVVVREFYTFNKSDTELAFEIAYNMLLAAGQELRGEDYDCIVCRINSPIVIHTLMGHWDMNSKVFGYSKRCFHHKVKLKRQGVTVRFEGE